MIDFKLPQYLDLLNLRGQEQRALMYISRNPEHFEVESTILRVLAYAVVTKSSDVHFTSKPLNGKQCVFINIRNKSGFDHITFNAESSDTTHFETKLLQMTNNTSGGTQSEIISTRFSLDFPSWWARNQGLKIEHDEIYKIDIRVQFQKTFSGFSIVCRILDQQRTPKLGAMGLGTSLEKLIRTAIHEPSGLILVSGPTGSGKTTLLNAMLCELNDGSRSIFTIENPVEFRLSGNGPITQIQTHGEISFAAGLRSALRSDPDVILIGEIRDSETMEVALQAAQTGHLVLATIHASNAIQTISRMIDLTLDKSRDAFRVSETLRLVLAQRLIDTYEPELESRNLSHDELDWLSLNGIAVKGLFKETISYKKVGVRALIEAVQVDHLIKKIIRAPVFKAEEAFQVACKQLQYETLAMSGMRFIEQGQVKLSDCMLQLDINQEANQHRPLRTQCVNFYNIGYNDVARVIDNHHLQKPDDHSHLDQSHLDQNIDSSYFNAHSIDSEIINIYEFLGFMDKTNKISADLLSAEDIESSARDEPSLSKVTSGVPLNLRQLLLKNAIEINIATQILSAKQKYGYDIQ